MRLLTIVLASTTKVINDLQAVRYDEKGGIDALNGITEDLQALYNPGYINPDGEVSKNEEALVNAFIDLRKVGQETKSLSEIDFTNKQGRDYKGVDAVQSMSSDVEALNQENP